MTWFILIALFIGDDPPQYAAIVATTEKQCREGLATAREVARKDAALAGAHGFSIDCYPFKFEAIAKPEAKPGRVMPNDPASEKRS